MKTIAVILAGGVGSRFGLDKPKQFAKLAGINIIDHTIKAFNDSSYIDEIFIIIKEGFQNDIEEIVIKHSFYKVTKILIGGAERSDSSLAAISALCNEKDSEKFNVLFHDAVRPFVDEIIIQRCIDALGQFNAVDVAIETADTIIEQKNDFITNIPTRSNLLRGQTPQAFKLGIIKKAYDIALKDENFQVTDDCGVVFKYLPEEPIYVVKGSVDNIKITHEQDIFLADKLFQLKTIQDNTSRNDDFNTKFFAGKSVIVFGGSYGIGLEIVKKINELGGKAFSFSRSETNTYIENTKSVEKAFEIVDNECGKVDFVINTAAILIKKPLKHMSHKEILDSLNVNYLGVINITKTAESYLEKTKGSLLLFTSSSYTRGRSNYSLYSSSKAAVVNFTQAVAEEWAYKSIRINCINPQRTKTPMRITNFGQEPEGSLLDAKDVAIRSLTTLSADYTGQVIDIRLKKDK
jgi:2-C-methyl-D-erythritol 4-phosphate cytidylyltransferase